MNKNILLFFSMFLLGSNYSLSAQDQTAGNIVVTSQSASTIQQTPQQLLTLVSVQIVNATIGPSKVDGSHWSGTGKVNPGVSSQLAQLLMGSNPYTGVVGLLSSSLIQGSGKPAPYGVVEVAVNGQYYPKLQGRLVST